MVLRHKATISGIPDVCQEAVVYMKRSGLAETFHDGQQPEVSEYFHVFLKAELFFKKKPFVVFQKKRMGAKPKPKPRKEWHVPMGNEAMGSEPPVMAPPSVPPPPPPVLIPAPIPPERTVSLSGASAFPTQVSQVSDPFGQWGDGLVSTFEMPLVPARRKHQGPESKY